MGCGGYFRHGLERSNEEWDVVDMLWMWAGEEFKKKKLLVGMYWAWALKDAQWEICFSHWLERTFQGWAAGGLLCDMCSVCWGTK